MFRIDCHLEEKRQGIRMTYVKNTLNSEDNELEKHDVVVQVRACRFKRKKITHVLKRLFLDYQENKPSGVGCVGVGIIRRLGPGVTDFKIGTNVVFLLPENSVHSGVAHFCIAPAYLCFACPTAIDPADGVAIVDALIPTYCALQNRVSRGDTVLVCNAHTPTGQIILQTLHHRGCKIIVYLSTESEIDIIGSYRNMIDCIFKGWLYRSNIKDMQAQLMKESDELGYSMILNLTTDSPFYPEGVNSELPTTSSISTELQLSLSSSILLLAVGGHLVCGSSEHTITKEMTSNLFAKGCSLHYLNPGTCLMAPHKLGSLLNYLHNGMSLLEAKTIFPPKPVIKSTMEDALQILNNKHDDMNGSYIVEFKI